MYKRQADVLRRGPGAGRQDRATPAEDVVALLDGGQDAVGALPRLLLGAAEDRTEGHADPLDVGAPGGGGGGADGGDLLRGLGERLAPQREGVGVLAADPVGGLGGAAEEQRDAR